MSIEEMEKEFDPRTWRDEPFGLLLAEGLAITNLVTAELTEDSQKIGDAKACWEELNA